MVCPGSHCSCIYRLVRAVMHTAIYTAAGCAWQEEEGCRPAPLPAFSVPLWSGLGVAPKGDSETVLGNSVIRELQGGQSSEEGDGFLVALCRHSFLSVWHITVLPRIITVSSFSPPNYLVEYLLLSPFCTCKRKYWSRLRNLPDFPECLPEARLILGLSPGNCSVPGLAKEH